MKTEEIISENLKSLLKQNDMTQKQLAVELNISESQVSDFLKAKRSPRIETLISMKNLFGFSLDEFVTTLISPEDLENLKRASEADLREYEIAQKYFGSFYAYYFDTGKSKGKNFLEAERAIRYGIFFIYENSSHVSNPSYGCIAVFGLKDIAEVHKIKTTMDAFVSVDDKRNYLRTNYGSFFYQGTFSLGEACVYMNLNQGNRDRVLAIFYRVDSTKPKFIGGSGTINSVSRGREHAPTIQYIGLSRNIVTCSAEEIERALLLNYPSIKMNDEADELLDLMKQMFYDESSYLNQISDFQKKYIFRDNLKRYIQNVLIRNEFRYKKVSNDDDDDWYHLLKHNSSEDLPA